MVTISMNDEFAHSFNEVAILLRGTILYGFSSVQIKNKINENTQNRLLSLLYLESENIDRSGRRLIYN